MIGSLVILGSYKDLPNLQTAERGRGCPRRASLGLACIAHKPWKKEQSLFCLILTPVHFYVMEFIDGETLDAYVRRKGPLELTEALNISIQVSRA